MKKKNENEILLTQDRLDSFKEELNYLINVERPKVIEDIKDARNQGDLSENAEYDVAREKQGQIEARITELEHIISKAKVIQETKSNIVSIGSTVKLRMFETKKPENENKIIELKIVGSLDADPFESRISNLSPLAVAILGQPINEIVEVEAPEKYSVEILSIETK
ncbi:transcription elongation factor GreA [Mesomycoplasma lagogenitalium]|uniref:Transcription elongation factor GreA n=1 Tax=Mesomycoplasma lagogenitalium TaxID=171286 RepID=A0ABY8LW23_9BACT|nr:transcription elongation factor GreA [Mesomycoplasma lagogenitalium]WGI36431.1 transcription elongation factor GreA [Mesomycoplasma lagogenitalium]